jgi:hypothetical protein
MSSLPTLALKFNVPNTRISHFDGELKSLRFMYPDSLTRISVDYIYD